MPRRWNGFALEAPAFAWYSNGLKRWMAVGARRLEEDIRRQVRWWISQRREAERDQRGEGEAQRVQRLNPGLENFGFKQGLSHLFFS